MKMYRIVVATLFALSSTALLAQTSEPEAFDYPKTKKIDHVDVYHGTEVADPFRWLEDDVRESSAVEAWVEAQNEVTFGYLESLPYRELIRKRVEENYDYAKQSIPFREGDRYFFQRNEGLQNQFVLYVQDGREGEPRVLLDPNEWSEDGTVALGGYAASPDGSHLAYSIVDAGSDWRTWKILDIDEARTLPEELRWSKFSGVAWTRDNEGFFYGRYPTPEEGAEFQSLNTNMKIYYHRLGEPQSEDTLVYWRPEQPEWGYQTNVTDDGRYLILTVWKGTDSRYRVLYRDLEERYAQPVELIDSFDNDYTFIGNEGTVFYFKTDYEAPNKRLIAIDIREPEKEKWRAIIPENESPLRDVSFVGGRFVGEYLKDAKSLVRVFSTSGKHIRDIELPGIGSAYGFEGDPAETETFYSFSSFATPPSIFRYDVETGKRSLHFRSDVDTDPGDYVVKQVFYESKDGTRVPMFITHKRGLELDGSNPTLLYGYGGFDIPITPGFSSSRMIWMELGGVYAVANIRGGGEYGETWHKAGTKLHKQNVFDDFIAAAEWLIENGYTKSEKLAIQGGSNGGLLVGAVMTQRPDLFGAALPGVGVMDMLRFHRFTAGRYWVDDYGSSDDPEEFAALHAYSPYHNLRKGIDYPATLVTTADTDDRVVPSHSFKFAARLQEAHAGGDPVLIRIETRAGHGGGKPTSKAIEEYADRLTFLVDNLDMTIPERFGGRAR